MRVSSLRLAGIAVFAGISLGGCAYGGLGYGPYGGVNVGIGSGYGYGYDPYYSSGYGGYGGYGGYSSYGSYGSYYGSPYYGWYDGFYYPGSGYYVYDRYRNRHRWSDAHRRYWESRRPRNRDGSFVTAIRENWGDYIRNGDSDRQRARTISRTTDNVVRVDRNRDDGNRVQRVERRREAIERQVARTSDRQQVRVERRQERTERQRERSEAREERRRDRRDDD